MEQHEYVKCGMMSRIYTLKWSVLAPAAAFTEIYCQLHCHFDNRIFIHVRLIHSESEYYTAFKNFLYSITTELKHMKSSVLSCLEMKVW
jgi:hypothetical protein